MRICDHITLFPTWYGIVISCNAISYVINLVIETLGRFITVLPQLKYNMRLKAVVELYKDYDMIRKEQYYDASIYTFLLSAKAHD